MKLNAKEDIEAPLEEVFANLCDFESFERAALRRGAEVVRADQPRMEGVGQSWRAMFDYRGKKRVVMIRLTQMDAPNMLEFNGISATLDGLMRVDLVALSRRRTRLNVSTEVTAKTLASRIFLQSLKLARGRISDRFARRVRTLAISIEDRLRKPTLG